MWRYLLIGALIISNLGAEDGFDDEGFDDEEEIEVVQTTTPASSNSFIYYGSVDYGTEYSFRDKFQEISSSKVALDLKLEYKQDRYKIKSDIKAYKDFRTNSKDDDNFDINELFVEGDIKNIDYKVGRQIIVWGKSDNIRITDTLNRLDKTAFGMVDIKDLRLGRFMSKFGIGYNGWDIDMIAIEENMHSKMPKEGSDYYIPKQYPKEEDDKLLSGGAISISKNFQGQDIALYLSNDYVDNDIYKTNMFGVAYNMVFDSFLFKTEIAYFDNYDTNRVDEVTDGLFGIEYNGISDGSISFEVANKSKEIQYAIRWTQSYFNDSLDLTALWLGFGKDIQNGAISRVWADYDIDDSLKVSLGVIDYKGGDNPYLQKIEDNDRVFGKITYSF